jgi:hypothetical protein
MTDHLAQPATAAESEKPSALSTTTQTRPTLRDLFTGGWTRPQASLPTALGRPLVRLSDASRTMWHRWMPAAASSSDGSLAGGTAAEPGAAPSPTEPAL